MQPQMGRGTGEAGVGGKGGERAKGGLVGRTCGDV